VPATPAVTAAARPPAGPRPAAGLAVGLVVTVVVLGLSVVPGVARLRAAAGGGCASADTGHVGLAVDFGTVVAPAPPSSSVETSCQTLSAGETGADLLVAAGHTLSWGRTGLLCSIDGYPASGCGTATGGGFQYWSYWHGGSTWTYATGGPAAYRLAAGGVEGWRFVQGSDASSEPPPRSPASGPCPVAGPSTTAATVVAGPGSGGGGARSATAGPTTVTTRTGASPTTTAPTGGGATATSAAAAGGTTDTSGSTDDSSGAGHRRAVALGAHGDVVARPGHGSPVGVILVGAAIVGLLAVAALARRRRSTP
jgi:hypothetical protein